MPESELTLDGIAEIAYEALRHYSRLIKAPVPEPFEELTTERREAFLTMVATHCTNNGVAPIVAHQKWLSAMRERGQEDPSMRPFSQLPPNQQRKAVLVKHVVRALVHADPDAR